MGVNISRLQKVQPGFVYIRGIATHIFFQLCGENSTNYHDEGAEYCCIKNELNEELKRGFRNHTSNPRSLSDVPGTKEFRKLTKDKNGPSSEHNGLPLGNGGFYRVYNGSISSNTWASHLVGTQRRLSYRSSPTQLCPTGASSAPHYNRPLFQHPPQAYPIFRSISISDAISSSSVDGPANAEMMDGQTLSPDRRVEVEGPGSTPRCTVIGNR